ncbi:MAG: hypothetical protein QG596_1686 [Actinomycetota bacterium]|nr:hypothetical protein [Actinomycetota bacterium]
MQSLYDEVGFSWWEWYSLHLGKARFGGSFSFGGGFAELV